MTPKVILITGASGNLGGKLRRHLQTRSDYVLRLLDLHPEGDETVMRADLSHYEETWASAFRGADVIVHLAANSSVDADWSDLTGPNIDAVLNVHLAAVAMGAPRLVLASSVWAMADRRMDEGDILESDPRPGDSQYGASKLFAERTARAFGERGDLTTVALRIGACRVGANTPFASLDPWEDQIWLSNDDFCRAVEHAINAPLSGFTVVNLISAVENSRWSMQGAALTLGFKPRDQWSAKRQPPQLAPPDVNTVRRKRPVALKNLILSAFRRWRSKFV